MAENRHIGNSMNTIQWTHPSIAPSLALPPDRMLAAAMVAQHQQPQAWQQAAQQHQQAQQQPPQQVAQPPPQQFGSIAVQAQPGYGVAPGPAPPMSLVHTNGIAGNSIHSGGVQSFRQYDAVKQFGSLPVQSAKRSKISVTSKTNLYISGLSESDNDETVRELVRGVVEPKSCKAMMNDGKCRGSGFIDCVSEEDAEKAMQYILESSKLSTKKLSVKYANENEKDTQNVYVRNLPKTHFTNDNLQLLFSPYGQVTSVKLLESNGTCTGTGFVRFASAEQAQMAVESMNREKKLIGDCDRPVTCKLADKTDPRRKVRSSPPLHGSLQQQQTVPPMMNGGYQRRQNGASQQPQQQAPQQQQPMPAALLAASMQNMTLTAANGAPTVSAYHHPHQAAYTSPAPQAQPTAVFYHHQAGAAPTPTYLYHHHQAQPQPPPPQPAGNYAIFPYPGHVAAHQQPPTSAHHYPGQQQSMDQLHHFYQHQSAAVHTQQQI